MKGSFKLIMDKASLPMMSRNWDGMHPNFYRRYKWAYKPEYDGIKALPVASPNFYKFIHTCEDIVQYEVRFSFHNIAIDPTSWTDIRHFASGYDTARRNNS